MAYVRPSVIGDPALLAPNLREADIEELGAVSHRSPQEVLYLGYTLGNPCRTFVGDTGNVIAMFGVTPMPVESPVKHGVIWCLTTPELFLKKMYFMRHCRHEIKEMCKGYDKVLNFVYHKNTRHIRWIKAMGFTMEDKPRSFGWQEKPFYYFEKVIT